MEENDHDIHYLAGSESHPHHFSVAGNDLELYTRAIGEAHTAGGDVPLAVVRFFVKWGDVERLVDALPPLAPDRRIIWKDACDAAADWVTHTDAFGFLT